MYICLSNRFCSRAVNTGRSIKDIRKFLDILNCYPPSIFEPTRPLFYFF